MRPAAGRPGRCTGSRSVGLPLVSQSQTPDQETWACWVLAAMAGVTVARQVVVSATPVTVNRRIHRGREP